MSPVQWGLGNRWLIGRCVNVDSVTTHGRWNPNQRVSKRCVLRATLTGLNDTLGAGFNGPQSIVSVTVSFEMSMQHPAIPRLNAHR